MESKIRTLAEMNIVLKNELGRYRSGVLKVIAERTGLDYHVVANILNQRKIANNKDDVRLQVYQVADKLTTELIKSREKVNKIENGV